MDKELLVEQSSSTLTLTLNRPEHANALSPALVEAMIDTLDKADPQQVRCCVIRGSGRHFCAGFDLSDLESLSDGDLLWRFIRIETMLQAVHHASFPVIALAQGQVIGAGADLFAACWQRIATPDAKFQMPGWNFELALGTRRLTALVGSDAARDLLIDTRRIDATHAEQIGLVSHLSPDSAWGNPVTGFEARFAALSPIASRTMLSLTNSGADTRDQDFAAIVRTAGRPGLRDRIVQYRERVVAERNARKRN